MLSQHPGRVGGVGADRAQARPSVLVDDRGEALCVLAIHREQLRALDRRVLPIGQGRDEGRDRAGQAALELGVERRVSGGNGEEGVGCRQLASGQGEQLVTKLREARHSFGQRGGAARRRRLPAAVSSDAIDGGRCPLTRTPRSS